MTCLVVAILGIGLSHAESARSQDDLGDAGAEAGAGAGAGAGVCGVGMIDVEGDYCAELPEQKCLRFASSTTKARCAEFAPSEACAWTTLSAASVTA